MLVVLVLWCWGYHRLPVWVSAVNVTAMFDTTCKRLDLCCPQWIHFGSLEHHRTSWNVLEHHGTSWNIMECPGTLWNVLECPGMLWNVLECPGMLWNVMELARTECVLLTADKC
jgi:hypothetical protein